MANEIHVDYTSGDTLYAIVRNAAGEVWYVGGQVFEAWGTGSHTADDYDIPLTDKGGHRYVSNFDVNIPAGRYSIQAFLQAGANPADSDSLVEGGEIIWSGVGEVTSDKLLANKAVQNKSTGEIKYYDNDGQTVLLTHTPTDAAATITRTPS
ncbi:MAG: hypothetical protein ACETWQ_21850 [Phycisphaerae bacterium]